MNKSVSEKEKKRVQKLMQKVSKKGAFKQSRIIKYS